MYAMQAKGLDTCDTVLATAIMGCAKQPSCIALGNKGPLAFAGLWDEWKPTHLL